MARLTFQTYNEPDEREPVDLSVPIPKGEYFAKIIASDLKTTKSGTGQYLELTWEINGHVISGEHENRKIWQRINTKNDNPVAARIGKDELNRVCKACGLNQIQRDSTELHGREVIIGVKIKPAEGGYSASNDISYVKSNKFLNTLKTGPEKTHTDRKNSESNVAHLSATLNAPDNNKSKDVSQKHLDDEIPF